VPAGGIWQELLNTDADAYDGSGVGNFGHVETVPVDSHGFVRSVVLTLPPLAALVLAPGTPPAPADQTAVDRAE
jgi:1,4-alpha-glucan branching enzyme